jgi:protein-S-isoprenylcysteine O-methyltransferase Ste14
MISVENDSPNVVPWPPIIVLLAVVASMAMSRLWPLASIEWGGLTVLGAALIVAGLGLDLSAIMTMRRANTNIMPNRAADLLVTTGPFRFSRNPIYLGNTVLLLGIGLTLGNYWFDVFALVAAWLVDQLAIRREERHLSSRFGAAWDDYASRTPRWLI